MPTEIADVYFVLHNGTNVITAQSDGTLTATADIIDVITKNDLGFMSKLTGDNEWSISHTGFLTTQAAEHFLIGKGNTASVEVDTGGGTFAAVPGIQSTTLTLTQELAETPPGIDQDIAWTYYRPTRRMWSLEMEGHYYSLSDAPTYQALWDAQSTSSSIDAQVTVAGLTFTGTVAPESFEVTAGASGENATVSLSTQGSGQITQTGTAETEIGKLLDGYFDQSLLSLVFRQLDESGSQVDQSTEWVGSGYASEVSLTIERGAQVEMGVEITGDGALTPSTYSAV